MRALGDGGERARVALARRDDDDPCTRRRSREDRDRLRRVELRATDVDDDRVVRVCDERGAGLPERPDDGGAAVGTQSGVADNEP
ncbi:MAG TPA: hypothetical protein VHN98_06955 [Acidimicrobiales bacterium]|nr:hypothetical protein [Acidimicrobiales bacterium]